MDKLECKAVRPWFSCRPVLHAPAPTRQQPALPMQPSHGSTQPTPFSLPSCPLPYHQNQLSLSLAPNCTPSLNEPALTSLCRQQPRLVLLHPPGQGDVRTILRTLRG